MRILPKRLLIMFSVALNIGFVIMAIVVVYQHPKPFQERSWRDLVNIVERLDLPAEREQVVLEKIGQFRAVFDQHHRDVKQSRGDILRCLARPGAVDRNELHRLIEAADLREKLKNQAFKTHVLDLRGLLGNEKGAQFFSLLSDHLKSEDPPHHP